MKKKILILISIFIVFNITANTVSATDMNRFNTTEKVDQVLIDFGFNSEDIKDLPNDIKMEFFEIIEDDPIKLDIDSAHLIVDNISTIEYYTNTSDEKLQSQGITKEEIKVIRDKLSVISEMSLEGLQNEFELSHGESKLVKLAAEKNPTYIEAKKYGDRGVTVSGQIANTTMSFSMAVTNNSKDKKPEYRVFVFFNWYKPFFVQGFSDYVALSWGGELETKNNSHKIHYYEATSNINGKFKNLEKIRNAHRDPSIGGVVYDFKQSYRSPYDIHDMRSQAKKGYIYLTLYQKRERNLVTKIYSQYAHTQIKWDGVSISYPPSINLGKGKSASRKLERTIDY